jgi:hypothetical protein
VRIEKIVGGALGIVVLATVFLLPFSSTISVIPGSTNSLYSIFNFFASNLGSIPNIQNSSLELIAYLYLVGTILILAAGVVGSFPFFSGVLGIVGMAMMTVSGFFSSQYTPPPVAYGFGFYLLWALSLAQLVMSFIGTRRQVASSSGT